MVEPVGSQLQTCLAFAVLNAVGSYVTVILVHLKTCIDSSTATLQDRHYIQGPLLNTVSYRLCLYVCIIYLNIQIP